MGYKVTFMLQKSPRTSSVDLYCVFIKYISYIAKIGESNRIRTAPEYGHPLYLRTHKSYKKMVNE